jgi:mannose-1-phosphate guanylyltransferase
MTIDTIAREHDAESQELARLTPTSRIGREAFILAGGEGVRLRPYTAIIPKPLLPIGGQHSILEIVLRQLARQGFTRATLAVGHLGRLICAYVGDGSQWGIDVQYVHDSSARGTLGPALAVLDDCPEHFLIMNADVLTNMNFGDLLETHIDSGAQLTVAITQRTHDVDFGVVDVAGRVVTGFTEKPTLTYCISTGVYAVARKTLRRYDPQRPIGLDDLIQDLVGRGQYPAGYAFQGYWLDIGRPDDYDRANLEFPSLESELLQDL